MNAAPGAAAGAGLANVVSDGVETTPVIGMALPAFTAVADRRRLRLFADVVGETDPVYTDLAAARAAGHPDLPIPPTFLFSLEYERPDPHGVLLALGVDLRKILHAEQDFTYHSMTFAGEELEFRPVLADIYTKKDGALRFVVRETPVRRGDEVVAMLRNTVVELT